MSWADKDGIARGLKVDLVNLVLGAAGIQSRHECLPWARALHSVVNCEADGLVAMISEQRMQKISFCPTPMVEIETRFYFRRDNPRVSEILSIKKVEDLRAFAVTDTLSGPWATINAPDLPLDRVTNQLIALRKVLGRRADITIMNNLIAGDLIRSNRAEEEISSIPAVVDAQSLYHLGLRADLPGGAALTAELDQIIQRPEIRRAIDTVLAKYL